MAQSISAHGVAHHSHLGDRKDRLLGLLQDILSRPGVGLGVSGGIAMLRLDNRSFDAIGGAAQLDTGDVTREVPHYELTIAGGASDLSIEPRPW